MGCIFG